MAEILMRKMLGAFRPVDEAGEDALKAIPNGEIVKVKWSRPRNLKHHRLYWALMSILWQNQSRYATIEELSDVVKCWTGHCTVIQGNGREIRIPKSISFAKMDQTEFSQYWDRVVEFAVTRIIPGLDRDDLIREVMSMVGTL